MTLITNMALPYDVVNAGREAMHRAICENDYFTAADAAIRAVLQAMCDCGMAKLDSNVDGTYAVLTIPLSVTEFLGIRLDADERKEQT